MSFTGKWISVSVLLPFLVAGTTAEEAKKTDRESNSLISRIRKNHKEDAATDRLNSSFLLVRSPDGRGSAFLVRLWEQPVIVTNAHVYLEMKKPEIVDVNGKVYDIKEVLCSKSRDLVILSYEGADPGGEMLGVVGDAANIPLSAKVTAYGNSLGDDVIVTQPGKLLGIGPDKIETDAPFVGGNSGGPILLDDGREVIGVATYLRHIRPDPTTAGSKYESSRVKNIVRHFATRIDNLVPDDLEPLKLADLDRERELVRESDRWVESIRAAFEKKFTIEQFQDFREDAFSRARLLIEGETVDWHSSYLKNKFTVNRDMITAVLKMLGLDAVVELSRIGVILDRNAAKLNPAKQSGTPVLCFHCRGSGKYSFKKSNPQYTPKSILPREIIEYKTCPVCDGNGRRPLWAERFCFSVPPEVSAEMGKHITVCEEKFCGFQLGGKREDELNRFVFYRKQPLYTFPNEFGETQVFVGNHQDQSAACTALTFMFDRLLGVEILTPQINGGIQEGLERYHQGRISDSTPMFIRAARIQDHKKIPIDPRGRPLLKPQRPARMEDEPRYDGMLVIGAHSSLGVIRALDYPALVKRCKESR